MSRRLKSWLLLAMLVLLINIPLAQSAATQHRLDVDGVDVEATVLDRELGGTQADPSYVVSARLPADVVDQDEEDVVSAPVDRATYDAAGDAGTIVVRVLPGRPAQAFRFQGERQSRVGLWLTLGADALLLGLVLVLWRSGRYRGHDHLRLEATADVTPAEVAGDPVGGPALPDGQVQVTGTVLEASEHEVLLDLGDHTAHVILDGHGCRVAVGAAAVARGRPID